MMSDPGLLDRLVADVQSNDKYRNIEPGLIRWVGETELRSQPSFKEAVKSTRSRLHQACAAFQEAKIDYPRWTVELEALPGDVADPNLQGLCYRLMRLHASTRERLPFLETFYASTLTHLPPVHSIIDLACGLNPLALPWIPTAEDVRYEACDIYVDMVGFINHFFSHIQLDGRAFTMDLTHSFPVGSFDLALLLKTLPCLEQLDKSIAPGLLDSIRARYLLVSFPARSLGGRSKGMVANYEAHFLQLIAGRNWTFQRFEFPTELAFLVSTT